MNELDTIRQAAYIITESQRKAGYGSTGVYLYTDIEGNILYVRLRMDKPDCAKWIRPLSRDDAGNWTQLKEPIFTDGKPLYNLQAIAREPNKPVFIVEGEKCANALIKLGLIATTSGGASSAKDAKWQILSGREVWIWADNDEPGKQYASDLKAKLTALKCTVHIVDISTLNLPPKGDCVDWLAHFKEIKGRQAMSADVMALPLVTDAVESDLTQNNQITVSLECAADIPAEAIQWMWLGWLAKGKLHVLAGQPGTGKTTLAISISAIISKGGSFPDGSKCLAGSVLIWSGEDSLADTLVPRLMAAGADLKKVFFVGDTSANHELRSFDPSTDMQQLMLKAASIENLSLLIIDPIVNAVAGDSHKNGEVRRALQPVVEFAEKLNCAVLGITHFSKGGQGKDPLERVTGSIAFGALPRVVLVTARIENGEKTKRIVCVAKCNVENDNGGFEYDIQQKEVQTGIFSSYALWGDPIAGSAKALLAEPDKREQGENGNSALEDAKDFLLEVLANGELQQKQIETDAKGANVSWASVRRAKIELNIVSIKSKVDGRWYWRLPLNLIKSSEDAQGAHKINVSTLSMLQELDQIPTEINY